MLKNNAPVTQQGVNYNYLSKGNMIKINKRF